MKHIGLMIAMFAVLAFVLPSWTAQEVKKDDVKKDDVKKDETKKDDPEKKPDEKKKEDKKPEKKPAPEKLVYATKFVTKIISVGANSSREFTVETYELDPKKQQDFQVWLFQQQQNL